MSQHPLTNRRRQRPKYHWNRAKEAFGIRTKRHIKARDRIHSLTCDGFIVDDIPIAPRDRVAVFTTPLNSNENNNIYKVFLEAGRELRKRKITIPAQGEPPWLY